MQVEHKVAPPSRPRGLDECCMPLFCIVQCVRRWPVAQAASAEAFYGAAEFGRTACIRSWAIALSHGSYIRA